MLQKNVINLGEVESVKRPEVISVDMI